MVPQLRTQEERCEGMTLREVDGFVRDMGTSRRAVHEVPNVSGWKALENDATVRDSERIIARRGQYLRPRVGRQQFRYEHGDRWQRKRILVDSVYDQQAGAPASSRERERTGLAFEVAREQDGYATRKGASIRRRKVHGEARLPNTADPLHEDKPAPAND
jgi:hypothetical protein